ncbi:MAG: LLM class flavin-dependent oxidoreductase [Chloroflexi bacterium]|nr:LLM class flavin-dependent oxidoreductase [Chloroflexota bacterium]MBV9599046.1 LLM class flavin-dependent oxidoreductase [Chloroflexota bacterium]
MSLRLGFLTHLHVGADAADSYRIALDLFQAAEDLGYDSGWVAQHHFLNGGGRMPSTLTFLAAVADRTRRIGLGTAIVILPLEDPVRLAEDAAVVDTLSAGRLQLGLGTGSDPLTFAAFGSDLESRRARYAAGFQTLRQALRGEPIRGSDAHLYPPARALDERIWESTLSRESGTRIGQHGSGLLLARTAFMSDEPTDQNQLPVARAYLDAGPAAPRIGLSRAVYPAADRRTAMAELDSGVSEYVDGMIRRGFFPVGLTQETYYARSHIHYGHPEEVVRSLNGDVVLPLATELICQVHPGHPTPKQMLAALERTAREVAPALGWRPAA